MGSLSKSLFKMSKKLMKSAVKDIKPKNTYKPAPAQKPVNNDFPDPDSAYDEFEAKYHKTCERMEHKVYSVDTDNIDPDKNVAAFKKMLDLAHELEDFCISHGQGGIEYFKENYSDIYQTIQEDLDCYLSDEYDEAKEYFEEQKAEEKAIKNLSGKILKEIQKGGGSMLQTELKKLVPESESQYYNKAIKKLVDSGKIEKIKSGGRIAYKTK